MSAHIPGWTIHVADDGDNNTYLTLVSPHSQSALLVCKTASSMGPTIASMVVHAFGEAFSGGSAAPAPPDDGEPVAWAIFAENGNCRVWFGSREAAARWSKTYDCKLTPLYAHEPPCAPDIRRLASAVVAAHDDVSTDMPTIQRHVDALRDALKG